MGWLGLGLRRARRSTQARLARNNHPGAGCGGEEPAKRLELFARSWPAPALLELGPAVCFEIDPFGLELLDSSFHGAKYLQDKIQSS